MYIRIGKRLFDIVVAFLAIILLSPLWLLLALLVRLKLKRPILFQQQRPGYKGRIFTVYKFRTMKDIRDSAGNLVPDKERLDKFGKFLRSTSLDELPELWNVLKGEMSLVGPRPLLRQYLELYTPEQQRRHDVRPGITGWAQVNGRNALNWQKKFELDIWYVDHLNFWVDMKILLMTVITILKRENITQSGHVTIEPFKGDSS